MRRSRIHCQMMRVISSPSISTTGFFTLIFAIYLRDSCQAGKPEPSIIAKDGGLFESLEEVAIVVGPQARPLGRFVALLPAESGRERSAGGNQHPVRFRPRRAPVVRGVNVPRVALEAGGETFGNRRQGECGIRNMECQNAVGTQMAEVDFEGLAREQVHWDRVAENASIARTSNPCGFSRSSRRRPSPTTMLVFTPGAERKEKYWRANWETAGLIS